MPDAANSRIPASPDSAAIHVDSTLAYRDRVVRAAVAAGLVSTAQVSTEWSAFRQSEPPAHRRFWRFIAERHPEHREAIHALAAKQYGFDETDISVSDLIRFVQEVQSTFTPEQWKAMSALRIVPVGSETTQSRSGSAERIVFASSDPTRIEVNNFLSRMGLGPFTLRYAAARSVDYALDRVVPVVLVRQQGQATIYRPGVRLVPLDPLREIVRDRKDVRRAA